MLSDDLNQKYVDCARMDPVVCKVKHKNAQHIWILVAVGNQLGLLLTTNEIWAQKDLVFSVIRRIYKLKPLADELRGLTE